MNHFWTILKASGRFKDNVQICRDVLVFFHDKQSCKCKNLTVGSLTYENDVLKMLHVRTAYFCQLFECSNFFTKEKDNGWCKKAA